MGGYVFENFAQALDIQGLARHGGIDFAQLWHVVRQQAPVPQRRLRVYGELLQVLGDSLLREHHRTRQYEQAAAIIHCSDDAIISKNLDGIITSWNGGAERLFGYTAADAIGQPVTILIPPERVGEESDILTRIRQGIAIEHYETVRRRKDGTLLDISLRMSPITDVQGRIVGASNMARDITARKQAENALRRLNEKLESLVEERTSALVGSQDRLRALATELNLAEQHERKRLATELHDHLQQLLALGKLRLGQGKQRVRSNPAVAALIKQVDDTLTDALQYTRTLVAELSPPVLRDHGLSAGLKWLASYMRKHDMIVTVIVPEEERLDLPEDQGVLLFQSVRELLINSSKHAATDEATVTLEWQHDQLQIKVRDEGGGFDLAAVETTAGLFPKFGLFSIRERMKALGGRFELDSAPGQGTTATLVLPLAAKADSNMLRAQWVGNAMNLKPTHAVLNNLHIASCEKPRIRVLLVDDHIMTRQGLRSVLDSYPDVELLGEAGDGTEALTLIEHLHPAVVVMDINMPNMNGIEATSQIKAQHPDVIVLGLSVNADGENQEAMMKAGAVGLLTKEAAVNELYQAIHAAVTATHH